MSFLSRSIRTSIAEYAPQTLRWQKKGKVNEATVNARKERKRLRDTNQFAGDYTGERPPHPWLNGKRLKALVGAYQTFTNKNRHNVIVSDADKVAMKQQFEDIGVYEYHRMRCEQLILEKNQKVLDNTEAELDTLPFAISEEIRNIPYEKRVIHASDAHSPYFMYFEQIARMYDEEHLTKLKVAQRLQRLADDKLGEND